MRLCYSSHTVYMLYILFARSFFLGRLLLSLESCSNFCRFLYYYYYYYIVLVQFVIKLHGEDVGVALSVSNLLRSRLEFVWICVLV
jgi:hypothetical protein